MNKLIIDSCFSQKSIDELGENGKIVQSSDIFYITKKEIVFSVYFKNGKTESFDLIVNKDTNNPNWCK